MSITCLGLPFPSDDARREHFRSELRRLLPELKKIEGFPTGEDEDIIALSDPPYYTACPNPWLDAFIAEWEAAKAHTPGRKADFDIDEPYASDVSEGKNNPIYNAHSYHTKVPHPAIMRYILHYTQPGDIVLDGFAGTGMTGVAAQLCAHPDPALKYTIEKERRDLGLPPPVWGARRAVLGDLSPIASFIAYNYNTPVDVDAFEQEARRILAEVEAECGWMYETKHGNGKTGKINYTVWSDVFTCPQCSGEIVFWEAAVDKEKGEVRDAFACPSCSAMHTKRSVDKTWLTHYDSALQQTVRQTKTVPVLINYSAAGKRYEKTPDADDLTLIRKIEDIEIPYWFPTDELPDGYNTEQPKRANGVSHVHHFYTRRNLWTLVKFIEISANIRNLFLITAVTSDVSRMARVKVGYYFKGGGGPFIPGLAGTLYIPSLSVEKRALFALENRLQTVSTSLPMLRYPGAATSVNSATDCRTQKESSVDYIFTDPPFGANIMYSELNFLMESWLKVKTNNKQEAIENKVQGKTLLDYQRLMERCFAEYFRVLKPGKWMTVEFSNTGAAVWNGIQTALQRAGFVIANVAALDKQQGSFKAVTTPTAVKQDLVISCYKPSAEFEARFRQHSDHDLGAWDFVEQHLLHLPVHLSKGAGTTAIVERSPRILYDRLITFYLMRGLPVPIDARDFQGGLKQWFVERDGMYFTQDQVAEYEEKKARAPEFIQLSLMVGTESEGLEWLRAALQEKPQTYQDLHPKWMQAITAVRKGDVLPELRDILQENFIQEPEGRWRVPDLNEAKDREALRRKVLLKEYQRYAEEAAKPKAKRLKEVRVEALRAGFRDCWERKDFAAILRIGELIPSNILLEDEQLLMYYDIARDRV